MLRACTPPKITGVCAHLGTLDNIVKVSRVVFLCEYHIELQVSMHTLNTLGNTVNIGRFSLRCCLI